MLQGFKPIVSAHPKIMILGSMPSVVSLQQQEYYGYKQNRFWKIMATYFQEEFTNYAQKVACMQKNDILLWDVIGQCEREGSLDSAIRNVLVNDIVGMLKTYPSITHILCNGKKSYELCMRYFEKQINISILALPSTSNANRTLQEQQLYRIWLDTLDQIYKG